MGKHNCKYSYNHPKKEIDIIDNNYLKTAAHKTNINHK
jgi:hypothetical protein